MTNPLRPTKKTVPVALPQPRPAIRPPPVTRPLDELSAGRGLALRNRAQVALGSPPFGGATGIAPAGGFRVTPLGGLGRTAPANVAALVSDAKRDEAEAQLANFPPNPSGLANRLREAADDPELRRALIAEAFASGAAASWLNGEIFATSGDGYHNEGYDDLTEVAAAVGEAYRAGDISDEQLRELAEDLGPERTAVLVQTLALGHNSSGIGGVVEALGEQAEALGYEQAAALAFTSNDTLIAAHYPTAEAQRAAFEDVEAFIEEYDQESDLLDRNPALRNAVGSAVVNAARLTANGNGWTQEELDEELRELGPRLTGELIAQAGERSFNGQADGPLDVLGDAATRVAAGEDGDDREAWKVNAAIAYTQSTALIEANLPDSVARHAAFDTLNAYLADSRDEWGNAVDGEYSLVRAPQAVEGVNRLLSTHPEMITEMLDGGFEGEADLVQLFESVALIPGVPEAQRNQLQRTIEGYVEDQLASAAPGNETDVGARVGRLFGTLQVAANRAVESAEASDDEVRTLALNLAAGVTGAAARVALTGIAGPLGSAVGGAVVTEVLKHFFEADPPTQSEIEDAFIDVLNAAGIEVSAGERGHDTVSEIYRKLYSELSEQLASGDLTPAEEAAARTQLDVVQGVLNGLVTFGDTHDSSEGAGDLIRVLNARGDEP